MPSEAGSDAKYPPGGWGVALLRASQNLASSVIGRRAVSAGRADCLRRSGEFRLRMFPPYRGRERSSSGFSERFNPVIGLIVQRYFRMASPEMRFQPIYRSSTHCKII